MSQPQPDGYFAMPASGKGDGVLFLHAWWGLNETAKAICRRLADAGFVVFAPDLYHGKVVDTIEDADALGSALDRNFEQAQEGIEEAAKYLVERSGQPERGIVVIAFSLGAYYAIKLADSDPEHIDSLVLFYGTGSEDVNHSKAAYLGHFAENDPYVSKADVDDLEAALKRAGRPVTFYRYPKTKHWFFEPDRTEAYDEAAAELAWERTFAFLKR